MLNVATAIDWLVPEEVIEESDDDVGCISKIGIVVVLEVVPLQMFD